MSNIAFRDSTVIIIETDRTKVRAVHGLAELLKTPPIELDARVGIRRSTLGEGTSSTQQELKVGDYLVGKQLEDALANGQDISIIQPFTSNAITDYVAAEAIW